MPCLVEIPRRPEEKGRKRGSGKEREWRGGDGEDRKEGHCGQGVIGVKGIKWKYKNKKLKAV